mgnify:FL=1
MIDFKLNFCYEGEIQSALQDVKGTVPSGKCIVLCGDSGCGKTTLLRSMNHLIPTFYEGSLKGYCRMKGQDINALSIGETGKLAASVFQDPRSHFFTVNSSTEVAFGLENHGVTQEKMKRRVEKAFAVFHLEKLKDRNVYELSSGERQLVSILAAWAMDTEILLLDEPTANLDFAAINQLREVLLSLKQQGKTLVISEHRLHYLTDIADEYWVMAQGEIREKRTAQELLALSDEQLSRLSLRTTNLAHLTLQVKQPISPCSETAVLSIRDVGFSYRRNESEILRHCFMRVHTGEVVGLIGSNGSGKTTLGKIVSGLLRADYGEINYNGKPANTRVLRKNSLFIMQEAEFQFFTNSVINELKYGHKDTPEICAEIERLLKRFGMWEYRNRHPFSLSGGQMQKLTLMLACLSSKPIIILDEPTAGLDAKSLKSCVALIQEMQKKKMILIITHDLELISQVCNRCICLSKGSIEQEFFLRDNASLNALMRHMNEHFLLSDNQRMFSQIPARCDPRTKLLLLFAAMVATSSTNLTFVFSIAAVTILLSFIERFYRSAFVQSGILILLVVLNGVFPSGIFSFFASFFPRFLVTWAGLETLIARNEAVKTLAAFRKFHIPEKLIMIFSVIFRFFPVISNDMKLMSQSIQTRGAFSRILEKIRFFPQYIEILIVPLSLRVIRIAETLSASAETRGIDLKCKRNSFVSIRSGIWDIVVLVMVVSAVITGLTI